MLRRSALVLWAPVSGAVALVLSLVSIVAAKAVSTAFANDPILEVASDCLTTFRYSGNSAVQDVRPQVTQRGVLLDGSVAKSPHVPAAIAGNPYENAWGGRQLGPIDLATGAFVVNDVDIALPAPGHRWVVGRTYNAIQKDSGGSLRDSNGPQGYDWFQTSAPEIRWYQNGGDHSKDVVYLFYGADRFLEFRRWNSTSDTYKGTNGAGGIIQRVPTVTSAPETFVYVDPRGTQLTFFGFTNANPADGQLWKIEDAAGNKAYVGDPTTGATAITNGFNAGGQLAMAVDSADRRYTYTCTSLNGTMRYTQVKAETKTGGTWANSPTGVVEVAKVDYAYYGTSDSNGDVGALKTVTVTNYLTDSGVSVSMTKYFRYYTGAYNGSSNPGYAYDIKMAVDFEGTRVESSYSSDSDSTLKAYSSAYLKYDTNHQVKEAFFNGECNCSGNGNGTHYYTYASNGSYTDNSGYDTAWCTRAVVQDPIGKWTSQYFDEAGQPLSRVLTDGDPTGSPSKWCTKITRDSNGCVTDISTPANITGYTHSTGSLTADGSIGLVKSLTRIGSNETKSFVSDRYWKKGTSGTAYLDGSWTYEIRSQNLLSPATPSVRVLLASTREYTTAVTSGTSGSNLTSYAFTYHSSTNTNKEYAAVESITTTYPTVTTGNNGSNAATTASQYFNKDGTLGFTKDRNAIIAFRSYINGQLAMSIEDADTSNSTDIPGGPPTGFSSSGSPIHWKTTSTYDAQGRLDATTLPNSMVKKQYYSKLGDGRLVHLAYNHYVAGGPTFYGPVFYTVSNQAGKTVVSATVGLTSNTSSTALTGHIDETDSDPITAMDLGTVKQMTTSIYSSPGTQLNEARAYLLIPGSGAGSSGTNYDKTLFGYDDAGHRWRVKEASGTISRTVFDKLGRVTEQWIGTNDNSFAGGEGSPTDNMVKVHANIYDSGSAGGNSLLTTSTNYVQDSTTDQRVATYSYDLRGRLILATTPTAPYTFHKYDNLGRSLATGLFSSTASIDVDNDDPTSETTNRMALSETAFDERGQVWKSTRHKITQSNGADADTLTSQNWYDAAGRLVKTVGSQVSKTTFDRIGRVTDSYTLIKDSDGSYSDSIAIRTNTSTGDYVAEERHTYFDSSGDATMNWTVSRFHSDFDTGETRGLLDTNADADRRYVTFSDLKGRASISTTFFDTTLHKVIDTVARGTNGDATYDRTSDSSAPSRADGRLRRTNVYNTDGTLQTIEDEKSLVTYFEYDAMGRKTKEVHNYNAGVNSGNPSGTADNQTITYAYSNGLMTTMTAVLPSSPTYDQVTTYTYGTTKGVSAGDSKYATGHLLQKVTYPDDAGGNRGYVKYAYNAQGQLLWQEDQATNVLEMVYDTAARETIRKATTVAGGFDSAVLRIERAYDSLGRPTTVTQYDAASSGSVTDETKYAYDDWGPVSSFKIDKDSAISGGGNEYTVSYTYAKATNGRQTVRRSAMTLPSGKSITLAYAASPSHDDELSRLTTEKDGVIRLCGFEYNGVADVVGTTFIEPNVASVVYGSSPGTYDDLDTFGRITRSKWRAGSGKDFYKVEIGYDRNSNIAYVDDKVHTGFDALYTIDSLNRLTVADEGTHSGGTITSRTRKQEWTLSHTGNWDREKLDLDGNGSWGGANEHDDTRTHTKANEIATRDTDSNASVNYTLVHDLDGNLTDDNQSYKYVWDVFGRLRKVKNQSNTVIAEFRYNGLGFRIAWHEDTDNDGDADSSDKWYYPMYDEAWRMLAVFREGDSSPKEEWVPRLSGLGGRGGPRTLDGVICRYRDANTAWTAASDGVLEERRYLCQNWRGDVASIVDTSGAMTEWIKYLSYGTPFGLPAGDVDSDGDCDTADAGQIQTWINGATYDVRGDLDLDGDVDVTDKAICTGTFQGTMLGIGVLSAGTVNNRKGYAGYERDFNIGHQWHIRIRPFDSRLGRWIKRDPLGYMDASSLYSYVTSEPLTMFDEYGLCTGSTCQGPIVPSKDPPTLNCCCCPISLTADWGIVHFPPEPELEINYQATFEMIYGNVSGNCSLDIYENYSLTVWSNGHRITFGPADNVNPYNDVFFNTWTLMDSSKFDNIPEEYTWVPEDFDDAQSFGGCGYRGVFDWKDNPKLSYDADGGNASATGAVTILQYTVIKKAPGCVCEAGQDEVALSLGIHMTTQVGHPPMTPNWVDIPAQFTPPPH